MTDILHDMREHDVTLNGRKIDAVLRDAGGYAFQKERADRLERLLWAAAQSAGGTLRISGICYHAFRSSDCSLVTFDDPATRDVMIAATERRG